MTRLYLQLVLAIAVFGCASDDPTPLSGVPLSTDLRPAIEDSRRSLETGDQGAGRVREDLDRYYGLWEMFSRLETRSTAEDSLFGLWNADMPSVLWPEAATYNWYLLRRYARFEAMFSQPSFPDTSTALGLYLEDLKSLRPAYRGAGLRRARGDQTDLSPFQRIWLELRFSRLVRIQGNPDEAARIAVAALPEARVLGGWRLEMETWFNAVRALREGDHLDDALHAAMMAEDLARAVSRQTGNVWIVQWARFERAQVLAARREVEPALDLYASCVDNALEAGLTIPASQFLGRASILTAATGQYAVGLDLYRRALPFALADSDSLNVPRILANIARRHLLLGNLDSCRVYLGEAERWIRAFPNPANRARFPLMQAEYYARIGDYATVDSLLSVSASLTSRYPYMASYAELHTQIIQQNMEGGRPDLAYRSIAALDSVRNQLTTTFADRNEMFDLEFASAEFLSRQGLFESAGHALNGAETALERRADPDRAWLLTRARGDLARRRGDPRAAEAAYRDCLSMSEARDNGDQVADSRLRLGFALLDQRRFDEVPEVLAGEEGEAYGGRFRTHLSTMLLRGVAESRAGRYDAAHGVFEQARALCRPASPPDLLARLDLETGRALAGARRLKEAAQAYGRVKQRLTTERDEVTGDSSLFFDMDVRRELAESLLALAVGDGEASLRGRRAGDALEEVQAFLPQWLGAANRGAGRLAEPQIVYFVGRNASFRWTISGGKTSLVRLAGGDDLLAAMAPVLADMRQPGREPVAAEIAALAAALGDVPSGWPPGRALTIVPDGSLFAIPWPALSRKSDPGSAWIDVGPIVLADVPRFGDDRAGSTPAPGGRLLAMGVDGTSALNRAGLTALHHAEREAREICSLWPEGLGSLHVGRGADWRSIEAGELSTAAVIHIASHALVYRGQADRATLLLAGSSGAPVTSAEIARLDLSARLVYLSCCEAVEGVRRGVGPAHAGLARAFLAAGAQFVIAPCARLDDETARLFAGRFYQHWLSGVSLEAALRSTQMEMREGSGPRSHPYYWAFYQLIG